MSLTVPQARDEMGALFRTKWNEESPAVAGSATPVRVEWDGADEAAQRPTTLPYAAFYVRHAGSGGQTLGAAGARRFTRTGLVIVEVRVPISNRVHLTLAEQLAIIARDSYEGVGTASGIWFRRARVVEYGREGNWYRFDALAEFEYDELK